MRILVLLSLIAAPALAQTPFGADSSPTSWRQLSEKYRYKCPGPFTTMKEKDTIKVVGLEIERNGSSWSVNGETKTVGKLKIGVLSAIKDAGRDTKKNLAAFANWFKQNKVDLVVANGDIALDEFDLEEVFFELGKLGLPVLVFAGNSESRTSFNRTATEVARKVPQLINGNWVRELRWGKGEPRRCMWWDLFYCFGKNKQVVVFCIRTTQACLHQKRLFCYCLNEAVCCSVGGPNVCLCYRR